MKEGISLREMAARITRQNRLEEDYLVGTRSLKLEPSGNQLYLHVYDNQAEALEPSEINSIAHRQVGNYLEIPANCYSRMRTNYLELLAENVNSRSNREPAKRMLRTVGGTTRAFLSSRYRRIDSMGIAKMALPIISQVGGAHFESCQITESRMYTKTVNTRLEAEVVPDDIIQTGLIISSGEVGQGSVNIQLLVYRLVCKDGMVINDVGTRQYHTGRISTLEENFQLYSGEALAAEGHAFIEETGDTVKVAVEETRFSQVIDTMRNATTAKMDTVDALEIVRLTSRGFHIVRDEGTGVLQHLVEGNSLALYGLSNAVTEYSQNVKSYGRATTLESIGYKILIMPPRQ